jgi:hypothetical protein
LGSGNDCDFAENRGPVETGCILMGAGERFDAERALARACVEVGHGGGYRLHGGSGRSTTG